MSENGFVDFDQSRQQRAPGFIIAGERFPIQDVSFLAFNEWQARTIAAEADAGDSDDVGASNQRTLELCRMFVLETDVKRFNTLAAKKLSSGDLWALSRWLIDQHTERPTIPPLSSGLGRQTEQTGSEDDAPSTGLTQVA